MKESLLLLILFVVTNTTTKEILCTSSGHKCKSQAKFADPKPCQNASLFQRGPCDYTEHMRRQYCDYCPDIYANTTEIPFNDTTFIEGKTPCRPEDGFYKCQYGEKYAGVNDNCVRRRWMRKMEACLYQNESWVKLNCTDDELRCPTTSQCVHRTDMNSPFHCPLSMTRLELVCHDDEFRCAVSHRCIPRHWVRDGSIDCSHNITLTNDSSDEEKAFESCLATEYQCEETKQCIPREWVMDGKMDCKEGDDEKQTLTTCNETEFKCSNNRCVMRYRVNDGFPDCGGGGDENITNFKCNAAEFNCNATAINRCIPRSWVGNSIANCPNSDLDERFNFSECLPGEFKCGGRCLPDKYRCDGVRNCDDCSDEIEMCDKPLYMRCSTNSTECIPYANTFDGITDCANGVDELLQDGFGFICKGVDGLVKVPQYNLLKSSKFCPLKEDDCSRPSKCVKCLTDDVIIGKDQICDGIINCRDLSDECQCEQVHDDRLKDICHKVLKGEMVFDKICNDTNENWNGTCIKPAKLSEKIKEPDYNCRKLPPFLYTLVKGAGATAQNMLKVLAVSNATKCDGKVECPYFDDECHDDCNPEYKRNSRVQYKCKTFKLVNFSLGNNQTLASRTCPAQSSPFDSMVPLWLCDGIENCAGGEDESSKACDENEMFKCHAGTTRTLFNQMKRRVSIAKELVCDGIVDCLNSADEINCNDDRHFYCEGGSPLFVHTRKVEDGKQDCDDNSDECPKVSTKNNIFSSNKEMLVYLPFRVMIWVMAASSIIFNLFVIVITVEKLRKKREKNSVDYCNRLFIINLATSDFFMGFALLILGVKISQFSGEYCLHDVAWRGSSLCQLVGVITLTSIQTSLFTLTSLTVMRLHLAIRPFSYVDRRYLISCLLIILSWVLSLTLALTPVVATNQFVTKAEIEPNPFFRSTLVHLQDIKTYNLIEKKIIELRNYTVNNTSPSSLTQLRMINITTKRSGFYTATPVCFPNFFDSKDFPFKGYSVTIIVINLALLLFIIISYAVIYKKSLGPVEHGPDTDQNLKSKETLRRRVTLLVGTNTASWLPVCVMALLSFSQVKIAPIVNVVSAVLLIPINCAFNPIIYSRAHIRFKKRLGNAMQSTYSSRSSYCGDSDSD